MTPRRAWKPPNTGNTWSMVSAMVASCRSRSRDRDGDEEKKGISKLKSELTKTLQVKVENSVSALGYFSENANREKP